MVASSLLDRCHLEGFAAEGEEWSCPPCFAGQECGYSPKDASTEKPQPFKSK